MKKINDQANIDIRNELNIIKKLDNQFILKYHDNFNVQGILCIITEYCKVNYIIILYIYKLKIQFIFKIEW
jgi:hypothetical protein